VGARIGDLHATAVSPFQATIAWSTGVPTAASVATGPPGGEPTLWQRDAARTTAHTVTLSGLELSTPYRVWVRSAAPGGGGAEQTVDLTTLPAPSDPQAKVQDGVLQVDGSPFFPLMVFEQCPDTYRTSLQAGINLFAGDRCGGLADQRASLGTQALSASTAEDGDPNAGGTVGTFFPDEADGHNLTGTTLPAPPPGGAGVRFLTLTNHFYSGAAPLARGRAMYPGLVARADMVGFDLYPLQGWCMPNRLADVYQSQQELDRLAAGKPTYQWIEVAGMRCPNGPTAVTPATVRAESLLAIAGGAHGLGFFPAAAWTGAVGEAIAEVSRTVRYVGPALIGQPAPAAVEPAGGPVLASVWARDGARYVVAVNSSYSPAQARISVSGLGGRPLSVFDEGRTVASQGDTFTDGFAPLAAHVYVAAPAES
jgi:hypothetical protein